jgi:Predicted metal-dependent hydrolase
MAGTDRVAANSGMVQIELPLSNSHDGRDRRDSSSPRDPLNPSGSAPLVFVRHPRAKRYLIRLTDAGTARVTIPRWGSKREAQAFAEREQHWIEAQRRRWRERQERQQEHEWQEGQEGRESSLRARAKTELPVRLMALAATHGLADRITKISVRNQKWRWGSCSPNGHICLNWRLVTMADDLRDYVLIHELMHLRRMDHSARFWKLVAEACPNYQQARAALRADISCRD